MSSMDTFTGKKIDPMEITAEDITMKDIAHALSLICRGGGHIKYFYSVGQHSINCYKEARARKWTKRMQLACLLHDASEAYISDIVRPVKGYLTNYLEIEQMIMEKVAEKFGLEDLTAEEKRKWRQIDDEILDYELKAMMTGHQDRVLPKLFSKPDVSEKPWRDVESEFMEIAASLTAVK
ncbi:MAG: phosphohydrolase [Ruminococcus sp.]|jgi:5'-deoxynucleotidase YfbR-like HD superfamily hydrolase